MSKDSNGFSDPYVVFTGPVLLEEKRTVIIEKVRPRHRSTHTRTHSHAQLVSLTTLVC